MFSGPSRYLAVFALVVASCGGTGAAPAATTASNPALEAPEPVLLSYALEPGAVFTYEVVLGQDIRMTSSGDPSAVDGEDAPGEADLHMEATATFSYAVAAGPEPETYEITITGEFADLSVSGTVDGEPVDPEQIPDFAALGPVETTIVVDAKGKLIPDTRDGDDLFGGMDFLGGGSMPGAEIEKFFGPPLPDGEVTVGDTWTETMESPMPFGGEPIVTTVNGRVSGVDVVNGVEVFVIETTTSTSQIEFDLSEFFAGFFGAFLPEDATEEEKASQEALTEAMKFLFAIDPSTSFSKSWLDPDTGLVHRAEIANSVHFVMDVAMPDENTDELVEFGMDMTLDQEVTLRYLDSTGT